MKIHIQKIMLIAFITSLISLIAIDYFSHTYIKAEFSQTDPMPEKMGVYFRGYKIGKTSKLKISKNFKTTYLYITINQHGLHLPKNITAEVKKYNDDIKYVDIVYPRAPMIKFIRTGDIIKGKYELNADGISDTNQAHLDNLSAKGERLLSSATETAENLSDLFNLIFDMLDENRENLYSSSTALKKSMDNLEVTTTNLKELTTKMNSSISEEIIKNSAKNLETTTSNIAASSKDFSSISQNFIQTSSDFTTIIPKLSTLIDTAQIVLCNINKMITGLMKTLKQNFSGIRFFLGKAIK